MRSTSNFTFLWILQTGQTPLKLTRRPRNLTKSPGLIDTYFASVKFSRKLFLKNLNCTKLPLHGYFYPQRGPKYAFLTTYPPHLVHVVFKRLLFKLSLLDVFFFRYYQVFSFFSYYGELFYFHYLRSFN